MDFHKQDCMKCHPIMCTNVKASKPSKEKKKIDALTFFFFFFPLATLVVLSYLLPFFGGLVVT